MYLYFRNNFIATFYTLKMDRSFEDYFIILYDYFIILDDYFIILDDYFILLEFFHWNDRLLRVCACFIYN